MRCDAFVAVFGCRKAVAEGFVKKNENNLQKAMKNA
jgi:hypothetical protein